MDNLENKQVLLTETQISDELSADELDMVSGGAVKVEIKDAGGLISRGIGALKRGVDKADDWRRSDRGPNLLRHLGSVTLGR